VIAGEARGFPLRCPSGAAIRPTPDRVREALFSILGERVAGAEFLDLYAGCGAVGIEALSRGATRAVFVEAARPALEAIRANLERCRFTDRARIVASAALAALQGGRVGEGYAVAYLDPPYDSGEDLTALEWLGEDPAGRLVAPDLVIVEHRRRRALPGRVGNLAARRTALYGDTALTFYGRQPAG
jgi:16S rRNA (guanine(966)-N(2))-methyltransferase RsmD